MKKYISKLQMHGPTYLEGIGNVTSTLPMHLKDCSMVMYFDSDFPTLVWIEAKDKLHFIPLANIQSATLVDVKIAKKVG